jgi:flavin-dependent dehydrogenase
VRADLAIAGAGPVGLATAILAAERGLSSIVLETRTPPLDKACGEGLMPKGVAMLRRLGVDLPPGSGRAFAGIRYVDGDTVAEGRFAGGEGLGLRRTVLSEALLARTRDVSAELRFGTRVLRWRTSWDGDVRIETSGGVVTARLLVGADGLRSRVRRAAGLEARWRLGRSRFGVRRHFRVAPWSRFVEVHWADGIEAYVTPVADDEVGVALLWHGESAPFEALLSRVPTLASRLHGVSPSSAPRGAGPFRQRVSGRTAHGVALVGDAAGYLDPLTGEGVTLGFRCAEALVDVVAREADLAEYERAYRRLSASYYRMTRLLLAVAALPPLRRRVVAMLARHPDLFDHLLAVNAGQAPLHAMGVGGALRLVGGLLA